MGGPLAGLVVVDAGWGMASAVTSMLFADYGARVIKVERPGGGPDAQWIGRSIFDRSKLSVEVDLHTSSGLGQLLDLLSIADVFIESNRPGEASAHGFGYEQIADQFPRLVYASISGYGQDTPDRDRPGFGCLVAARMGLMAENGDGSRPVFLGHPHLAYGTAFVTNMGVLAALRARDVSGHGQHVDASLLDAVQAQSAMNWMFNEKNVSYLAKSRSDGFGQMRIITDLFQCADGEYLMVHTGGDGGFKRTMDLLGIGKNVRSIEGLEMSVPLDDEELRLARDVAPTIFATRPRQEWIDLFHSLDLAALPVLRPSEVLNDEQVQFAAVTVDLPSLDGRVLRQAGPVIKFRSSPADIPTPAHMVGADNAILDDIGSIRQGLPRRPVVPDPRPLAHALEGIRVLDLSSFFATAYGAKFLSDLGADVIKVEALAGDQMRPLPDPFEACQRGKRALAVDLKAAEGRRIVHDLVATADIVMHNLRPGKAEKLGIDYETLRQIKPDLIYCYLPGFGSTGPKSHLKSFAPLVSGFTGLLYEGAGAGNPPVRRVLGNEDYNNGFLGAITALLALQHRALTGEGQYAEMPQLHSSLFVTTGQVIDIATGDPVYSHLLDQERLGFGPLYGIYVTADSWLVVACVGSSARRRLVDALAFTGVDPDDVNELHTRLCERLARLSSEDAFALLDSASVPCEIPLDAPVMGDYLWYDWALDAQRVFEYQHATLGYVRDIGLSLHLSHTPAVNKGPQVPLGQHTVEILREIGYDEARVEALLDARTCIDAQDDEHRVRRLNGK